MIKQIDINDTTNISEMFVHVPLCTHYEPKNITIFNSTDEIDNELKKYLDVTISNSRNAEKEAQDIVLYNDEVLSYDTLYQINELLNKQGLFVAKAPNYSDDFENLHKSLEIIGKSYWITMLYTCDLHQSEKSMQSFIFASKKYHPTADINLQRADLLDNLEYYNSDIHKASFITPTFIDKALKGLLKK